MINRFLAALQFLTVIPVRRQMSASDSAAIFFPLIGVLIGLSAAAVLTFAALHFSQSLAGLLALGWLLLVTGCLHEDGLADVADAFRAGRTREKIMLILKDSRIGTYGGIALLLSTLLRWQALAQSTLEPWRALPAVLALSRSSLVVMAHVAPPVGEGLAREFAAGCTRSVTAVVVVQTVAFSFLAGWRYALAMILATGLVILCARSYFVKRLGGVNGDCLGATCVVVETVNLLLLACHFSI